MLSRVVRRFAVSGISVLLLNIHSLAQPLNLLHSFTNGPDGANPFSGLTLAGNTLYGTTEKGGTNDGGLVFSMGTDGTGYTVLHTFTQTPDGANPYGGMVLSGST